MYTKEHKDDEAWEVTERKEKQTKGDEGEKEEEAICKENTGQREAKGGQLKEYKGTGRWDRKQGKQMKGDKDEKEKDAIYRRTKDRGSQKGDN